MLRILFELVDERRSIEENTLIILASSTETLISYTFILFFVLGGVENTFVKIWFIVLFSTSITFLIKLREMRATYET